MRLPGLGSLIFLSVAVQPKADIQCLIHPALILRRDLPGPLAQAVLIQRADLFQQHHTVLGKAGICRPDVDMGGQAALSSRDVMAAAITVGLCRLPISFWTMSTGRIPPCSEPTTGERSA